MKFDFCFHVGKMSFFGGLKAANEFAHRACSNCRVPTVAFFVPTCPKQTAGIVRFCGPYILGIDRAWHISKVVYSVVCRVSVSVVDSVCRKLSVNIKPSKAMSQISGVANRNSTVFVTANDARLFSSHAAFDPNKKACFLVVLNNVAQLLRGKIISIHDAALSQSGQGPASVSALCWPRYFKINTQFKQLVKMYGIADSIKMKHV